MNADVPADEQAEKCVLGALLTSESAVEELAGEIDPELFFFAPCRTILGAIVELHSRRVPLDIIALTQHLRDTGKLESVGGAAAVTELATTYCKGVEVARYELGILRDLWLKRRLVQLGRKLTSTGPLTDTEQALRETEETIREARRIAVGIDHRALTIRNIPEILSMRFDDAELILPNGYLALGERTAICGMGGIGKSRLTMQLALCCRTGRDFLGWPANGRQLRWLFLQTENSCRRLQSDLTRMLTAFSPAEIEAINSGIFFHTLEEDDDGFLMLDAQNVQRVGHAIQRYCSDVCVFDPLRDFGCDDLNSDRHMTETLREISRLTRRGNVKRVPLVVHHAVTGKAGMQKTLGYDRSSFGRNSKVLFSWARAQINIAPAVPDDNELIIIASAKCSNSEEFQPFAARLSTATMLYEREDGFDFDEWRHSLESPRAEKKLTTQAVFDLLPASGTLEKAEMVALLKRKERIGEKRARQLVAEALSANAQPRMYEWHLKRSGKRDEIHLSRQPQNQ